MTWRTVPAWSVLTPIKRLGHPSEEVLSVYREYGVIPKSSRDDNFNRTPDGLEGYQLVEPSDAVFNKMKAWSGSVGVSAHRGIVSPDYLVCRTNPAIDRRFLHHLLRSRAMFTEYHQRSKGIRPSQWRLYWDELASIELPMPPLAQQRRIADYLDAETDRGDRLRDRNHELSRLALERHERAVLTFVTGGVSPTAHREVADGSWFASCNSSFQIGPYAMYGRTGSGHTPSRSVPEYWTDCDIPWITTGDVKPLRPGFVEYVDDSAEKISTLGMANSAARLHPAGTVFLSRTASVGFAGIMAVPMATSQDFFTWTPDPRRLRPEYLLWALRAMRYAGHFDRLMYGSTHKTIYVPDLMVLRGPVPPVDEQDRIVHAIREQRDETIALLDALGRADRLLAERKQALITAAVTGEIAV